MLQVENIVSGYGAARILDGISLEVRKGELVAIVGPNGAGKTTLLLALSKIIPCSEGTIIFDGINITSWPSHKVIQLGLAHVPEGRQVISPLSVYDNLILGTYSRHRVLTRIQKEEQLDLVFRTFPILKDRKKQISGSLSGGEQQMLAIARGLMSKPKLLLADEPSIGLSPIVVSSIGKVLKELNEQGLTILLVEQNAVLALGLSQRAYVLNKGKVVLEGKSSELARGELLRKLYLPT
jgi:branched-chain amino acid transport system ATP-binding protein